MLFIGIDPGKTGAIGVSDGRAMIRLIQFPTDNAGHVVAWLDELDLTNAKIMLEQVGAMPGQGVVSMFEFGRQVGWIQSIVEVLQQANDNVSVSYVRPPVWQAYLGLKKSKEETRAQRKKRLYEAAKQQFPNITTKQNADAILITEYCRRIYHAT